MRSQAQTFICFNVTTLSHSALRITCSPEIPQGLLGQTDMCWEAAGDLREAVSDDDFARGLTWDVRLAVALLEATSDPQIGGKFWDVYGRMLPQPHTIAVRIGSRRVAVMLC